MLNGRNLVLDSMGEQISELRPWATAEFWDFANHEPIPNSVYVLGRQQVVENRDKFLSMAQDPRFVMVFGNSAEGAWTLTSQIRVLGLEPDILAGRVLLIGGASMPDCYPCLQYDHFLIRMLDYEENRAAMQRTPEIFAKPHKPYRFLFLNGRARAHRKYLWERLRMAGLLDYALWTMLDGRMAGSRKLRLSDGSRDLMDTNTPIRSLPPNYEVTMFADRTIDGRDYPHQYVKNELFRDQWGEVYLQPEPYIDTYFSLVTETLYEDVHSFRTEKIAKVLTMGHPWICATSRGFYRDLRNMGFQTFDGIIDEGFDQIEDDQSRLDRIVDVVRDLCERGPQGLADFSRACEPICKYNQQHLMEIVPVIRQQFPQRFFAFVNQYRP